MSQSSQVSGPSRRFGRYELSRAIGRGATGVVHLGRSPDGRDVAVKVLHRGDAATLARFDRERRLLETLGETDGFVPLLDFGASPHPHIVMPYLPGGTLRERLARGPLAIEETVRLGRALAEALGRAARLGIVHRDLKPDNVLFDGSGRPLIADLGLAKHFSADPSGSVSSVSLSRDGAILGTAGYMSPEQMYDAKVAGPAADVFALGAILYECLAGAPAFCGENLAEVLGKVESGQRRPLLALRPDAPRWLDRVVTRSLARDPAERYASGTELARALASPSPASARWAGALLVAFVLGVFLAGTGIGIWLGRAERSPSPVRPAAPPPGATLSGAPPPSAPPPQAPIDPVAAALARNPDDVAALTARGLARQERGDLEGALADLGRVVALRHGDAGALKNRAAVRELSGDLDGALSDYKGAAVAAPADASTFVSIGLIREKRGELDFAAANYGSAKRADPGHAPAWLHRGLLYLKCGDRAKAREELKHAVSLDAGPVGAKARMALAGIDE